MSKRGHGEEDEAIKRQKQDDNIDAALLNEGEAQGGSQQYDTAATAAAVAHAAYGDLIQHPGDEGKSGGPGAGDDDEDEGEEEENHEGGDTNPHAGGDGEGGVNEGGEEEEEEEDDVDDQIKDPDHVPEDDDDENNHRKQSHRRSSGSIKNGLSGNASVHSGSGSADVDFQDAADGDEEDEDDEKKIFARRTRRAPAATGSDEWRKQRKDSHKEVERRRRENINTAINKLSELLPVKESSKATVLARAAEYIQKLKETESANIDKWTLQKLLSEQNQSRLSTANERLQDELGRAYKEIESLRQRLKEAGIEVETANES
ncbi:basic helix-loop-helix protein [Zygosaccharomyces mellis]|uniref:Basic helix-loop-helix protein n=1 Tax=Zygosaccharomyces mellis TaxID=42258 RepID=A0A4C2E676_9SACH|nr:basic helix-loop-helix protein [Zygosaccharomyces mellis]